MGKPFRLAQRGLLSLKTAYNPPATARLLPSAAVTASTINVIEEMARRLPRWHLRAACRGEDPGLFFLEKGHDYAEARKICATCPVFDECLEEAVPQNLDDGIFAGMTAKNRRQVAKGQAEPLRATCAHCGALFVTTNVLADFCGLSCRTRAVMEARNAEAPAPV